MNYTKYIELEAASSLFFNKAATLLSSLNSKLCAHFIGKIQTKLNSYEIFNIHSAIQLGFKWNFCFLSLMSLCAVQIYTKIVGNKSEMYCLQLTYVRNFFSSVHCWMWVEKAHMQRNCKKCNYCCKLLEFSFVLVKI